MTRKEAINKIREAAPGLWMDPGKVIDTIAALGLLKLDPPVQLRKIHNVPVVDIRDHDGKNILAVIYEETLIETLQMAGYYIVHSKTGQAWNPSYVVEPLVTITVPEGPKFKFGDKVKKVGGDYDFPGEVRAVVVKKSGQIRYVVEDDRRSLHVFNAENLILQ